MQERRSAAAASLPKSPLQHVGDAPRLNVCTCAASVRVSLLHRLLSPEPASLGLSPPITPPGCHPGISAMFRVLACAHTCTLPARMSSSQQCVCVDPLETPGISAIWQSARGRAWWVAPPHESVCVCVCRLVCVLRLAD